MGLPERFEHDEDDDDDDDDDDNLERFFGWDSAT